MNKVESVVDPRYLLAPFHGDIPPAPPWFDTAIAHKPERTFTDVRGAAIETLAWGERGKPGLLFLHGNGACADWWSFVAPFFTQTHRIAAFSMSGMGGSGWRDRYSYDLYVDEAFAVAEATGLFAAETKPVIIGHSFGAFITSGIIGRAGSRISGSSAGSQSYLRQSKPMSRPNRPESSIISAKFGSFCGCTRFCCRRTTESPIWLRRNAKSISAAVSSQQSKPPCCRTKSFLYELSPKLN